jgi:hypothetical protein
LRKWGHDLRGEEPSVARQHSDKHLIVLGDLVHGARELVVQFSAERVELLGDVEGDDGDFTAVFDENAIFLGHFGGLCELEVMEGW